MFFIHTITNAIHTCTSHDEVCRTLDGFVVNFSTASSSNKMVHCDRRWIPTTALNVYFSSASPDAGLTITLTLAFWCLWTANYETAFSSQIRSVRTRMKYILIVVATCDHTVWVYSSNLTGEVIGFPSMWVFAVTDTPGALIWWETCR